MGTMEPLALRHTSASRANRHKLRGIALLSGALSLSCASTSRSPSAPAAAGRVAGSAHAVERREPPKAPAAPDLPAWSYVLAADYGLRVDAAGDGAFRASRSHGEHNGLDLLAPVGSAALAACDGEAKSGNTGAFGNWVKLVCPLPRSFGGPSAGYFSVFYAHLLRPYVTEEWVAVKRAQAIGLVGKTGNARGARVAPHLHLEVIVADDEAAARAESHSGLAQFSNWAVAAFLAKLEQSCLRPNQFAPRSEHLQRGRRVDPFVVLSCLSLDKPPLHAGPSALHAAAVAWHEDYQARSFDVDVGLKELHEPAPLPSFDARYFAGSWQGEYRGTQAFAALEVQASGDFQVQVETGPDESCKITGSLSRAGPRLDFRVTSPPCSGAEGAFGQEQLIGAARDEFVIGDARLPDAVIWRPSGEIEGPVWVFRRKSAGAPISGGP